jgi:hypothetical protein
MGSEVAELKKLVESLSKEVTRLAGKLLCFFNCMFKMLMFHSRRSGN